MAGSVSGGQVNITKSMRMGARHLMGTLKGRALRGMTCAALTHWHSLYCEAGYHLGNNLTRGESALDQ